MKIAAQLYTVRAFTQTEDNFAASIKKVADIGYAGVQLSAVGPIPPKFIADTCKEHGLEIKCSHSPPPRFLNDVDKLIEEHKLYNADLIGIGMIPEEYRADLAGVKKFISDFLPAAKKIKEAGLNFCYHNHEYEFGRFEGKLIMDYLLDGFKEADIKIILDTYWVQCGGCDPVEWIKKMKGLIPQVHFKDMIIVDRSQRFAEIGQGNLNWTAIIEACRQSDVKWVIVEQDDSYGRDPFDSLQISHEFLKKNI
jgi:sugar phosphate isomerase/epimerase